MQRRIGHMSAQRLVRISDQRNFWQRLFFERIFFRTMPDRGRRIAVGARDQGGAALQLIRELLFIDHGIDADNEYHVFVHRDRREEETLKYDRKKRINQDWHYDERD